MSNPISWTETGTLTWSDASPAKDVTATATLDMDAAGAKRALVQIALAFAAGIDGNATIGYRGSPDSGTTIDSQALWSQEVAYSAGNTVTLSFVVNELPWVQIFVTNGTSTEAELTLTGKYAIQVIDI